ncbi:hypothetical protein HYW20_06335 [Candidatus Woesearchaeota archaeon]|nr:hypothetical protein [Candidatus Woesearchaeota archaeon]
MNLVERCKEGGMEVGEFFEFAVSQRPRRTHLLDVGDYVVISNPFKKDQVDIESIAGLDSLEKGDFITVKGITGPISGNVFIKMNKGKSPEYLLIEGDGVTGENGSVYDSMKEYLVNRLSQN